MLQRCQASTWQCQEWCGHWNRNSAAWLGHLLWICKMSWRPVDPKLSAFNLRNFQMTGWILIGWYEKTVFSDWCACLLFKNFRHNIDPHGSPYIWKAFIHLLVRDAGALKFFPWLPLLRPIWIQRPRHPRPGLQGWGSETTKFAGSFCENTGVPVFVVRNLCLPKDLTWAFSSDRRSSLRGWFPRLSSSS